MNASKIMSLRECPNTSRRRPGSIAAAWLLAAAIFAGPVHGAPGGELDATFGDNGRLTINEAHFGSAILQQPDGKLLVAGNVTKSWDDADFAVLRLHPDGSPDESFGTNGRVMIDFAGYDVATGLALQADGRMIVAGTSSANGFALARLNPDGSLDVTFGGDGLATLNLGGIARVLPVLLLENGQVVVAGTAGGNGVDIAFARFHADGTLDTTFGTGPIPGTTLVDASGANDTRFLHDEPLSITRQVDGKYVACGFAETDYWDYVGTMVAVRVNPDGSLDTGFGIDGISRIEQWAWANTCMAMPDGTIILAGFRDSDLAFARLTSDGMKDATFGNSGFSSIDLGGWESVQTMISLTDGSLGAVGWISTVRENVSGIPTDMFFARLDPQSGLLDTSFGNHGVTIVDFGQADQSAWSQGLAVIQQADGKLVAAGNASEPRIAIALARVDPAGTGNAGFTGFVETSANITEGTAELLVSVRRTGGSTGELSVEYSTVADAATTPSDFTPSFGTLHWPSGDMDPKSIRVPITDDGVAEGDESFTVVLSNSSAGLAASEFVATIEDKAAPPPAPPPPPVPAPGSSGSSGGGGVCLELLMLLAMSRAFVRTRRRGCYGFAVTG